MDINLGGRAASVPRARSRTDARLSATVKRRVTPGPAAAAAASSPRHFAIPSHFAWAPAAAPAAAPQASCVPPVTSEPHGSGERSEGAPLMTQEGGVAGRRGAGKAVVSMRARCTVSHKLLE